MKEFIKYLLGFLKCKMHNIKCVGKCYIGGGKISNNGIMVFGDGVIVRPSVDMYTHTPESRIELGCKTEIGNHSTISAYNEIIIGNSVLTGPHVFISDHNHNYDNPKLPVCEQGVKIKAGARVVIDSGTWIGTNAVIVGDVHIGKNCVIGANSVVLHDIPDYSVAVGMPAKVIKKYNFVSGKWEHIST